MDIGALSDKIEINELLARYCHALDQRDWPSFRAIFTADATLDFTAFGGPRGGCDDLEAFLRPILDLMAGTQHMVSTVVVDLDGDVATARSAAIVPMTLRAPDGSERTTVNGLWYEDKLLRTHTGWRIRERRQVRGWASSPI